MVSLPPGFIVETCLSLSPLYPLILILEFEVVVKRQFASTGKQGVAKALPPLQTSKFKFLAILKSRGRGGNETSTVLSQWGVLHQQNVVASTGYSCLASIRIDRDIRRYKYRESERPRARTPAPLAQNRKPRTFKRRHGQQCSWVDGTKAAMGR